MKQEEINLYTLYSNIKYTVNNISNELNILNKKLDILIKQNGPKDVKAQQYDNPIASSKYEPVDYLYQDLSVLNEHINHLKIQLEDATQKKKNIEALIKDIVKKRENDLMLVVFEQHHICNVPLTTLQKKLYYIDGRGRRRHYDYGYLKNVNSKINKNISKCDHLLLKDDLIV